MHQSFTKHPRDPKTHQGLHRPQPASGSQSSQGSKVPPNVPGTSKLPQRTGGATECSHTEPISLLGAADSEVAIDCKGRVAGGPQINAQLRGGRGRQLVQRLVACVPKSSSNFRTPGGFP